MAWAGPPAHAESSGRRYDGLPAPRVPARRRSIARRSAIAAALLALTVAATAVAAGVPRLTGAVTDQTGVLAGARAEIEDALNQLLDEHGVQLFVLFVGTTGDLPSTDFVDEAARINSLGADDALLLVAIDDRTDAIWVSESLAITDAELNQVISGVLEPALRNGDFGGAVVATAAALGDAAAPEPEPTTKPGPTPVATQTPGGGQTSDGFDISGLAGIVLVAFGIVFVATWVASRLNSWRDAEERDRRTGKLAREANSQLVALDDRIRSSDHEAGFVEAQFGPAEAAPFRVAAAEARTELGGAFEIRQRLDDSEPEDPPTRELMLQDILERCRRATALLDAQAARIDELRDLEREAPAILASLPAQVEAQAARMPEAESTLRALTATYAEPAWAAVKGNVAEAAKGLAGAHAAIDRGTAAVASAGGAGAAREIVIAQQGIAGAAALLDAVVVAARTIREIEAGLHARLDAAEADIAAARDAAPVDRPADVPPRDSEFAEAEAALRSARAAVAQVPPEPIGANRAAATAERLASELLSMVREDAEQQARFAAAVEASFSAAHAEVDRARDFIATRRGGVGRRARTRLAEAERLLGIAEGALESDPKHAMAEALRADKLAGEAYSAASLDFARWDRTGRATVSGGDIAGAILGGIIGGILSGGGRTRGAGWGGSSWGSPGSSSPSRGSRGGGGGSGWGGGGRSSGGGFGGFGGGGGRSSGGGFGGGGGRSAGGRW